MIIERMGEASPGLEEMLEVLGARVENGKLVIPTHIIRVAPDGDIEVNVQHRYSRLNGGKWKLPICNRDESKDTLLQDDGSIT